jgi:hypothetical protein
MANPISPVSGSPVESVETARPQTLYRLAGRLQGAVVELEVALREELPALEAEQRPRQAQVLVVQRLSPERFPRRRQCSHGRLKSPQR